MVTLNTLLEGFGKEYAGRFEKLRDATLHSVKAEFLNERFDLDHECRDPGLAAEVTRTKLLESLQRNQHWSEETRDMVANVVHVWAQKQPVVA